MKKISVILLLVLLNSCASTTTIKIHGGDKIDITGASNELITYERGDVKVTSDRRGRANIIESVTGLVVTKMANTKTEVSE